MIKGFANNILSGKLTKNIVSAFLTAKKEDGHDLIMIRHAQSTFNSACEQYRLAHNIPYVWKELCNHQGFDQKVLFNSKFIDCPITQRGKEQCAKKKQKILSQDIDCVIVSPQLRALQTCHEMFKHKNVKKIVQPLLIGPIRSCSDICGPLNRKKNMFPSYNFSMMQNIPRLWFLNYLTQQQRNLCFERFKSNNLLSNDQKRLQLVNLLKQGKINEDPIQYRKRVNMLKERIRQYKMKYKKLAIVSHYYTIEYMSAINYQSCGTPQYYIDVQNCTPYFCYSKQILNLGQERQRQRQRQKQRQKRMWA